LHNKLQISGFSLSLLCLFLLPLEAAQRVAVLNNSDPQSPAAHGVSILLDSLRAKGLEVTKTAAGADFQIIVGGNAAETAVRTMIGNSVALPKTPEALSVWRGQIGDKPAIVLAGGDSRGLMYAALDTAEKVSASPSANPFQFVTEISETPYIAERGISTYTMQRAYFEQRLYDERYWTRYFDMLAADRVNSFVVIFGYEDGGFMAPLYPYFFNTPGFAGVEMVGITAAQQAKNSAAFKALIRIAHERGIEVTAGIWDHIYRGGVQAGGIPGASDNAGKRVPGLVYGVTTELDFIHQAA